MKIKLGANTRKFIEIEVELNGVKHGFKYFEKNTKQIKTMKKCTKESVDKNDYSIVDTESVKQFFDCFKGEQSSIDLIVEFYEENGNIYDFINMCDEELGKLNKKA